MKRDVLLEVLDLPGLGEALEETDAAMGAVLLDAPPALAEAMRPLLAGGKRLRASMCFAGMACHVEPGAIDGTSMLVAIELLHVASLVHDDVIDAAIERRGFPTVHHAVGLGAAIVGGDRLLAAAFAHATEASPAAAIELMSCLVEMSDAQHLESEVLFDVRRPRAHVDMTVAGKTGALFRVACRSGGILSGLSPHGTQCLGEYGDHFGAGFQLLDDAVDFIDGHEDLRQGVYTLPVIVAAQRDEQVGALLGPEAGRAEFEQVVEIVRDSHALQDTLGEAHRSFASASAALEPVAADPGGAALRRLATAYQEQSERLYDDALA